MEYTVTRQQILTAAESMIGLPFIHQGRSAETGVDCVGLLVVMGRLIGYPEIQDVEGYRRTPSAQVIRQVLGQNCDEIPLDEVREGDIWLMRMGGIKPRHVAICQSLAYDPKVGKEPMLLHASKEGVKLEPVRNFPASWFVAGFRVRGLKD